MDQILKSIQELITSLNQYQDDSKLSGLSLLPLKRVKYSLSKFYNSLTIFKNLQNSQNNSNQNLNRIIRNIDSEAKYAYCDNCEDFDGGDREKCLNYRCERVNFLQRKAGRYLRYDER